MSVSVVAGATVAGSEKDVGAPRTNSSKTSQTPTKVGPTIKKVAVKRKSEGQLDEEVGCSGHTRKPGGGKAAKLLPNIGASLQTIPGGEGCKIEAGKRNRETKESSQVLVSRGALQLTDPGAVQPVRHPGHSVGASSPNQGQGSVELQTRVQEAARSSDTKLERVEEESPKQVIPPGKVGTGKRP